MDMLGSLYVIVIIGKHFTVWILICRSAFNTMFNTKLMISFWYIFIPCYKVQPFLSDRWCFFLYWEGGNSTSAIYSYLRPFSSRRNYGFQMGIHHLWSSIVGYWEIITFFRFYLFLPEVDMLNIFLKPRDSGVSEIRKCPEWI